MAVDAVVVLVGSTAFGYADPFAAENEELVEAVVVAVAVAAGAVVVVGVQGAVHFAGLSG